MDEDCDKSSELGPLPPMKSRPGPVPSVKPKRPPPPMPSAPKPKKLDFKYCPTCKAHLGLTIEPDGVHGASILHISDDATTRISVGPGRIVCSSCDTCLHYEKRGAWVLAGGD